MNPILIPKSHIYNPKVYLKIEYVKVHPNDDYQDELIKIYTSSNGFHLNERDYFNNLHKLLNFNINENILKYNQFIRLSKIDRI